MASVDHNLFHSVEEVYVVRGPAALENPDQAFFPLPIRRSARDHQVRVCGPVLDFHFDSGPGSKEQRLNVLSPDRGAPLIDNLREPVGPALVSHRLAEPEKGDGTEHRADGGPVDRGNAEPAPLGRWIDGPSVFARKRITWPTGASYRGVRPHVRHDKRRQASSLVTGPVPLVPGSSRESDLAASSAAEPQRWIVPAPRCAPETLLLCLGSDGRRCDRGFRPDLAWQGGTAR